MLSDNSFPLVKSTPFLIPEITLTDLLMKFSTQFEVFIPENVFMVVWNSIMMFVIIYYMFEMGLLWGYG